MALRNLAAALSIALFASLGVSQARAETADSDKPAIYADRGAQTCMKCHDTPPVTNILQTPHAMSADAHAPFGQHACESCHGASPEHVASLPAKGELRAKPAVLFKGP